jgi:hypothetical protein
MSRKHTKRYLMLLAAVGLLAIGANGSGTFASFNAEVANSGNYFAAGTLLLHNTNGATTCTSESASDNLNVGTGDSCATLFTTLLGTSTAPQYAQLTLKNAGSLDASGIKFKLAATCSTVSPAVSNALLTGGPLSTGGTISTINFSAGLTLAVKSGETLTLDDGSHTQDFVTTAAAGVGATSVAVTPLTPNFAYANGTSVKSHPDFSANTANLCTALQVGVVETDASFHNAASPNQALGCAYGFGVDVVTNGCTFDTSKTLAGIGTSFTPLSLSSASVGNTGQLLSAGGTRYFLIGVKQPSLGLDNTYQNKKTTFGLVWHIDQA